MVLRYSGRGKRNSRENGVIEGIQPDAVVIDMSTISPLATRKIAARLKRKQAHMLDAPVSGGEGGAIAGTLSIMVGGDAAILNAAARYWPPWARRLPYRRQRHGANHQINEPDTGSR